VAEATDGVGVSRAPSRDPQCPRLAAWPARPGGPAVVVLECDPLV